MWAEVAKADVRPLVEEEARLHADADMRVLVQQLKARPAGSWKGPVGTCTPCAAG